MADTDRLRWDEKHARSADAPLGPPLKSLSWLPRARGAWALDLACGRGRHCGALLRRGYRVLAADVSAVAIAAVRARWSDAAVTPVQADLEQWPFARDAFDAIVQIDFLDRALFAHLKASTRPGGCVLVDTFREHRGRAAGPSNPAYLLRPGELAAAFADWEIVRHEGRGVESPREALCARKPPR